MYDAILIPTDGSAGAEVAAHHGLNLSTAFDSQFHFLSVIDDGSSRRALTHSDAH